MNKKQTNNHNCHIDKYFHCMTAPLFFAVYYDNENVDQYVIWWYSDNTILVPQRREDSLFNYIQFNIIYLHVSFPFCHISCVCIRSGKSRLHLIYAICDTLEMLWMHNNMIIWFHYISFSYLHYNLNNGNNKFNSIDS